jgi:hypothetical protein
MADKLLFKQNIKIENFHNVLSQIEGSAMPPYNKWLKGFKEDDISNQSGNIDGSYLLSEDYNNIVFFRPLPKNPELVQSLYDVLIQKLDLNESDIRIVEDEDSSYKDQGLDASTGIMNPIKIMFNKMKLSFSSFFPIFNSDDLKWSLQNSAELKDVYKSLGYTIPEINQDGNINIIWEDLDEWFYDDESNVIGVGYDDSLDIRNNKFLFQIEEQSEQKRYLCFQYIMDDTNIIGFRFEHGALEIIPMILKAFEAEIQFDWSIYWCLHNEDILLNSIGNYNDFKDIIGETGNVSW